MASSNIDALSVYHEKQEEEFHISVNLMQIG